MLFNEGKYSFFLSPQLIYKKGLTLNILIEATNTLVQLVSLSVRLPVPHSHILLYCSFANLYHS